MKSNIFFSNRGLIKQDLKQHGWIGLIYLVGLLFTLPLRLMMLASEETFIYRNFDSFFQINQDLLAILIVTVPISAGIFLFRYVQMKESTDMVHSLPIGRTQLYFNHIASGFILLLSPIFVTGIATGIVMNIVILPESLTLTGLLDWMGTMIVMTIFLFIFSVFVGMNTGQSITQGILTYILLFLPIGFLTLSNFQLNLYLYGFSETFLTGRIEKWSPLIRFTEINNYPFTINEVLLYLLLSVLFLVAGYFFYKYRQLESATDPIAFSKLKPVFKYGVTFCSTLVAGAYFSTGQGLQGWTYFGYTLGAIAGYIIAEMVLHKTWRIFDLKMVRGFLIYSVVITLMIIGLHTDLIGYETKVPKLENIQGVHIGHGAYQLKEKLNNDSALFHEDSTFIQDIRELHQSITTLKPTGIERGIQSRPVFIAYKLNNGRLLVREYLIPLDPFKDNLKPIMESEIYKRDNYPLTQLDKKIDKVTVNVSEHALQKNIVIADSTEIQEIIEALKQDILTMSYEEMIDTRMSPSNIELLFSDDKRDSSEVIYDERGYFEVKRSYQQVEKWLEAKGYLSQTRVFPEEIESIDVIKVLNRNKERWLHAEGVFLKHDPSLELEIVQVHIEDRADIFEALHQYSSHHEDSIYFVKFTTFNGKIFYGTFADSHLPTFIPIYFPE